MTTLAAPDLPSAAEFLGDSDALDRLEELAAQFARWDDFLPISGEK